MEKYIPKDAVIVEIKRLLDKYISIHTFNYGATQDLNHLLSFVDTLEVKEVGVDLGDPKGDKSAKYIIDTKTLEVKEVQEEPITEELEEASKEWLAPQLDKSYAAYGETKQMELTHFDGYAMLDAIEFGAKWGKNQAMAEIQAQSMALAHGCPEESESKDLGEYINELSKQFPEVSFAKLSRIAVRVAKWQKEQDKETIELAEDHAMLAGMEKMKEEMMAKAIVREVKVDAGGYPYIDTTELYDYDKDMPLAKEGDKVKVIILKGE